MKHQCIDGRGNVVQQQELVMPHDPTMATYRVLRKIKESTVVTLPHDASDEDVIRAADAAGGWALHEIENYVDDVEGTVT